MAAPPAYDHVRPIMEKAKGINRHPVNCPDVLICAKKLTS